MKRMTLKGFFQGLSLFAWMILMGGCASAPSWQGDDGGSSQPALTQVVPVKIIGEEELGSVRLNRPQGIAIDQVGNLYIVDSGNNRIVKCSQRGEFLKETGGFGWDNGEFNLPGYINMDNGLSLYITDSQNKRVQRFDGFIRFTNELQRSVSGE